MSLLWMINTNQESIKEPSMRKILCTNITYTTKERKNTEIFNKVKQRCHDKEWKITQSHFHCDQKDPIYGQPNCCATRSRNHSHDLPDKLLWTAGSLHLSEVPLGDFPHVKKIVLLPVPHWLDLQLSYCVKWCRNSWLKTTRRAVTFVKGPWLYQRKSEAPQKLAQHPCKWLLEALRRAWMNQCIEIS